MYQRTRMSCRDARAKRGALLSAAFSMLLAGFPSTAALAQNGQVNVLNYHNDLARTGQNLNETLLTPTSVSSSTFGRLFSYSVDGQVYAQPLYLAGVTITGKGRHNVVFVETEHDSIYAFDADGNAGANSAPLWHTSFINPTAGVTTVSATDINCGQITPEVGITGTPAIDPIAGAIYVVAMTKEMTGGTTNFVQRLHMLDMATGLEMPGSPVAIAATYPGTGEGGTVETFVPKNYKERAGLLLLNGVLYTMWASHCDIGTYHGWIMGYDAKTLNQVSVYNNTPNGNMASYWESGCAPAVDAAGNLYVVGANGSFTARDSSGNPTGGAFDSTKSDLGDCIVRLSAAGGGLTATDYFSPYDQDFLNSRDLDLGSSGAMLLPDAVGSTAHPHLLVSAGKEGLIYLVDRDNMGKQAPIGPPPAGSGTSDTNIVQSIPNAIAGMFSTAAYFNGSIYFSGSGDNPKAFSISNAQMSTTPTSKAPTAFAFPGSVPSVSASGPSTNGIVWMIENAGVMHAYDARNLANEFYNTTQAGARDNLDSAVKFSTPTITDGRVYVGTNSILDVYGLLSPPAAMPNVTSQMTITRSAMRFVHATGHYTQSMVITNNSASSIAGPTYFALDNLTDKVLLVNYAGVTTSYSAPTGSFYAPAGGTLGPGQSVTVNLEFANATTSAFVYTPRVMAGVGSL